jgi:hypothetical protein
MGWRMEEKGLGGRALISEYLLAAAGQELVVCTWANEFLVIGNLVGSAMGLAQPVRIEQRRR